MKVAGVALLALCGCGGAAPASPGAAPPAPADWAGGVPLRGLCEGSGAALWQGALLVADDEQKAQLLRFSLEDGAPLGPLAHPAVGGGAARVPDAEALVVDPQGGRWVVPSHSLSGKGKVRDALLWVPPAGEAQVFSGLLRSGTDLTPVRVGLSSAPGCPGCALPPGADALGSKVGGLDVEGAARWGDRLLLGLRGPLLDGGRALVLALPAGAPASGVVDAWALDLGGRGVRDMAQDGDALLILAGPTGGGPAPSPALYRWTPGAAPAALPVDLPQPADGALEAVVPLPDALLFVEDAGARLEAQHGDGFDCAALPADAAWARAWRRPRP
jgi:hypothetical protein